MPWAIAVSPDPARRQVVSRGATDGSNRPGIGVRRTQGGRRMFFKRIAIIGSFVDILADAMAVAQHENRASTERLRTDSTCRACVSGQPASPRDEKGLATGRRQRDWCSHAHTSRYR
ncbi:hypothetical protein BCEP4_490057 [Burkholderia cepacia]|nr:hypothetical protein BCEP4_490057 [Burkholderia cepacia]